MADSEWCDSVNAMVVKKVRHKHPINITSDMQKVWLQKKTHCHSHIYSITYMPFKTAKRNSSKFKTFLKLKSAKNKIKTFNDF